MQQQAAFENEQLRLYCSGISGRRQEAVRNASGGFKGNGRPAIMPPATVPLDCGVNFEVGAPIASDCYVCPKAKCQWRSRRMLGVRAIPKGSKAIEVLRGKDVTSTCFGGVRGFAL